MFQVSVKGAVAAEEEWLRADLKSFEVVASRYGTWSEKLGPKCRRRRGVSLRKGKSKTLAEDDHLPTVYFADLYQAV